MSGISSFGFKTLKRPISQKIGQKVVQKPLAQEIPQAVASKPLSRLKEDAYELEAKHYLSVGGEQHRDRFNKIKERLDQSNRLKKEAYEKAYELENQLYLSLGGEQHFTRLQEIKIRLDINSDLKKEASMLEIKHSFGFGREKHQARLKEIKAHIAKNNIFIENEVKKIDSADWRNYDLKNINFDLGKLKKHQTRLQEIKAHIAKTSISLDLERKKYSHTDWRGYNLKNINFEQTKLNHVDASGCNLDGAKLLWTQTTNCNFNNASINTTVTRFHGQTSTFEGATIGGHWSYSDLPESFRAKTIAMHPETQVLQDTCSFPNRSWEPIRDQMKDPTTPTMVQAKQKLAKTQKAAIKDDTTLVTKPSKVTPPLKLNTTAKIPSNLECILENEVSESPTPSWPLPSTPLIETHSSGTVTRSNSDYSLSSKDTGITSWQGSAANSIKGVPYTLSDFSFSAPRQISTTHQPILQKDMQSSTSKTVEIGPDQQTTQGTTDQFGMAVSPAHDLNSAVPSLPPDWAQKIQSHEKSLKEKTPSEATAPKSPITEKTPTAPTAAKSPPLKTWSDWQKWQAGWDKEVSSILNEYEDVLRNRDLEINLALVPHNYKHLKLPTILPQGTGTLPSRSIASSTYSQSTRPHSQVALPLDSEALPMEWQQWQAKQDQEVSSFIKENNELLKTQDLEQNLKQRPINLKQPNSETSPMSAQPTPAANSKVVFPVYPKPFPSDKPSHSGFFEIAANAFKFLAPIIPFI